MSQESIGSTRDLLQVRSTVAPLGLFCHLMCHKMGRVCYVCRMRYGKIDFDYANDLMTRTPDNDGPIYMVNFMKYRDVAGYDGVKGSDSSAPEGISGVEADNLYNPTDVLTRIGAHVAFMGDVVAQSSPEEWDRMAIVKYASRSSFMEMQNRPDFKEKHVHKEAGMLYTIVMGTLPQGEQETITRSTYCTFELTAVPQAGAPSSTQVRLAVEGAIVGDGRTWKDLTMIWSDEIPSVPVRERGGDSMTVVAKITVDRMNKLLNQ